MIGVLSRDSETRAVSGFFQLFKTPWEFYVPGKTYDVVITTLTALPADLSADALVIYNSEEVQGDQQIGVVTDSRRRSEWVELNGIEFPVYGDLAAFRPVGQPLLKLRKTSAIVGTIVARHKQPVARVGIDLFKEAAFLLSEGQPAENARCATLDLHISLLRTILANLGVGFIEVLAVPPGYDFMACLTHDVDFVGIRDHKFDHTMWGFFYRCFIGSFLQSLRGRLPWSKCIQNWVAALSLPFVHLGLIDDFWLEFDRYTKIEQQFGSTFFFIPFKGVAGNCGEAPAPKRRAAKYDLSSLSEQLAKLAENGCEIGLHGLNAWQDVQSAQSEQRRVREVAGLEITGTRMHWLYWKQDSPKILEEAGFTYDSTFGYNDQIGFRAGTTQPFCPLVAERLFELPLNIQDSALFYSDRMGLSESEALNACRELIKTASSFGGVLTLNWHTRSLSPERLWGDFYCDLLSELREHRVWFGTGKEIVAWFQKRRELRFDSVDSFKNGARVALGSLSAHPKSGFTIRFYHPNSRGSTSSSSASIPDYTDTTWNGEKVVELKYCDVQMSV